MRKRKSSKGSKLKCAFCQGKGVQPGAERLSCIICRGRGRVVMRQPYGVCKECQGGGRKQGTNLYCFACKGKGLIEEISNPIDGRIFKNKKPRRMAKKNKKSFLKEIFSTLKIS